MADKTILVERDNGKEFRISAPEDSTLTFGPFSPPREKGYGAQEGLRGTLRVYAGQKATPNKVIAVFTGVRAFRDITLIDYAEKVAVEEGATLWKSDQNGYERKERVQRAEHWSDEEVPELTAGELVEDQF